MRPLLNIPVKESVSELKDLQRQYPGKFKVLQMLLLMKRQGAVSKNQLALSLGVSDKSVQTWRTQYLKAGIIPLLEEKRGGKKIAAINAKVHHQLSKRLINPQQGFRSFIEIDFITFHESSSPRGSLCSRQWAQDAGQNRQPVESGARWARTGAVERSLRGVARAPKTRTPRRGRAPLERNW